MSRISQNKGIAKYKEVDDQSNEQYIKERGYIVV